MRSKIIKIDNCTHCPFYNFDDSNEVHKWGKHWCDKLDIDLDPTSTLYETELTIPIPEICPLPDNN